MTKRCKSCGKVKGASEFYKHPDTVDKLMHNCKECHRRRVYTRKYPDKSERESMSNNGHKEYTADVKRYLQGYSPAEAVKKFCKPQPEPYYTRIVKHVKTRDIPQWFCWTCRRWHTSAVERADCPHCKRPLRQNGQSFSAWRVLTI